MGVRVVQLCLLVVTAVVVCSAGGEYYSHKIKDTKSVPQKQK